MVTLQMMQFTAVVLMLLLTAKLLLLRGWRIKNGEIPQARRLMSSSTALLAYTDWIAQLRVEEAKRIIAEHPEWGNDAVAEHCGFADRTVLQRTFKRVAGITPQKYHQNIKIT